MSATHDAAGQTGSPYQVPPEPNRWPAIGLAVGVHVLLLAFLYIGVSWQNNTPVAVEAEVWDVTTQTAAPPPPPPPPPQEAEPEPPAPRPVPVPVPKVAPPREIDEPVAPKQPDIALERKKKREEEAKKQRAEEEREEREQERERALAQKREDAKKAKLLVEQKERELAEKKKQDLAKKEAEKKELDKKKLADREKAEKAEKAAKEKADKLAKANAEKAENAKLDKLRKEEMSRLMAGAGSTGSTGSAEKSTGPRSDKSYTAAITAKVKGNTSYAGSLDEPGNPTASFRVDQLPTGEIISVKKTRSSGVPSFDDAVEKGITKSSPLPKKKDGTVERSLLIEFHMKDLQ